MALDPVANFVRGSTDAATDSTQTTISVVDASVFPNPANGEYNLVLWYDNSHPRPDQDPDVEIVRVTARDTTNDDLTVTRGQEGTAGASHPSGSALQLSPTAKMFSDIADNFVSTSGDTMTGPLIVEGLEVSAGTIGRSDGGRINLYETGSIRITPSDNGQAEVDNNRILTTADEGSGNGLDADTVDGQNYADIQNWVNNNADVPNADFADSADSVDGYDIQKNGTDGNGIINFKT